MIPFVSILVKRKILTDIEKNEKRSFWRKYRSEIETSLLDENDKTLNLETAEGEPSDSEKIELIGESVRVRLKETVFKKNFSDLKHEDWLRPGLGNENFTLELGALEDISDKVVDKNTNVEVEIKELP